MHRQKRGGAGRGGRGAGGGRLLAPRPAGGMRAARAARAGAATPPLLEPPPARRPKRPPAPPVPGGKAPRAPRLEPPAVEAECTWPSVGGAARGAVAAHLTRGLAHLGALERPAGGGVAPRATASSAEIEAVHQLRVELRRARLCAGLWEGLVAPGPGGRGGRREAAGLRRAASRVLKLWGPVRDADVLRLQLEEAAAEANIGGAGGEGRSERAALAEVLENLRSQRQRAETRAMDKCFQACPPPDKETEEKKKKKKKKSLKISGKKKKKKKKRAEKASKGRGFAEELVSLGGAFAGQKTWRAAERAASGKKNRKGAGAYQQVGRASLDEGSAAGLRAAIATPLVLGPQLAQVLLHPAWHAGTWGSPSELQRAGGTVDMPEEVHDLRKAIRDLRYAAEALAPASGVPLDSFVRTLKAWQDTLGEMHDAHVLASKLGPWRGRLPRIEAGLSRRFGAHREVWEAYRTQVLGEGAGWSLQISEVALSHEGERGEGVGSGQFESKENNDF